MTRVQTMLPATIDEAGALTLARRWIAALRNCGDSPFVPDAGSTFTRQILRGFMMDSTGRQLVIADARDGWIEAIEVVNDFITECTDRQISLPGFVQVYAADQLQGLIQPVRDPGRSKVRDLSRDIAIVATMAVVSARYPSVKPTTRSARKRSLSGIVGDAMGLENVGRMNENAVRKVWEKYGHAVAGSPGLMAWLRDISNT